MSCVFALPDSDVTRCVQRVHVSQHDTTKVAKLKVETAATIASVKAFDDLEEASMESAVKEFATLVQKKLSYLQQLAPDVEGVVSLQARCKSATDNVLV